MLNKIYAKRIWYTKKSRSLDDIKKKKNKRCTLLLSDIYINYKIFEITFNKKKYEKKKFLKSATFLMWYWLDNFFFFSLLL